jgi:queuosine precursor transporter
MLTHILNSKPTKLFLGISAFFVANALIAECIGGKIFSLEKIFGFEPANLTLFGQTGLSFTLTCGVLLWPLEFIITDIVNEYYGPKAVRRISYTAVILISYAFVMFYASMKTPPAGWWIASKADQGIPDMQAAYSGIFGQGMWIILGSLVAFLVSQLVDVFVFHKIKKITGDKKIWLRATGSTLVSQLIDSFVVLAIAFKLGNNWSWKQVLAIGCMNYIYKFTMAIILTPVIYLAEKRIEKYLGHDTATKMKRAAMGYEKGDNGFANIPAAG